MHAAFRGTVWAAHQAAGLMPNIWATPHADQRAAERTGINPTVAQWRDAVIDIITTVSGDSTRALMERRDAKSGHNGEIWYVHVGSVAMKVVYAPRLAQIITVLPWGGS